MAYLFYLRVSSMAIHRAASFAKEQKDRGVLSDQAAGLWKPLAPHALRAGLRLQYPDTPVAGLLERIIRSRFEPHG